MPLNSCVQRLKLFRRINACLLCSKPQASVETIETNQEKSELPKETPKKPKRKHSISSKKHLREIEQFFDDNPSIKYYKDFVPNKILQTRPYKNPDYLYLVCPNIAKSIAQHVVKRLQGKDQVIAESNPGFGLITEALLQQGVPSVRLYELNIDFQGYLQETFKERKEISLYKKDLFTLYRYAYFDNIDQGQRVTGLLQGVPKKSWTDEPVMTAIGTITKKAFLNYLVKSIVLQKDLATYGRIDLFLITYENLWQVFTATKNDSYRGYRAWTILLQTFLEAEFIDKYPRKLFLPWQAARMKKNKGDIKHLYLLRITMKKELPLLAKHFVPFYCFMMTLYGLGNTSVVATCEKWVPGCGQNLLLPTLSHDEYFEDMDVFTKFRELSPENIFAVFREVVAHPNYQNSPFNDMIEQEWLKSETIDTDLHDELTKTSS